jgi:gamma-tubulin complex component 2
MLTFSELTYLFNSTPISLLNMKNNQYINIGQFKVNGIHPFLINKEFENNNNSTAVRMFLSSNPKAKQILTYGNQVSFMTDDEMFLSVMNNGEVKLEPLKGDKLLNTINLPPNSKFTIVDPYNQSNFSKPLLFNDEIVLRSNFGSYLNCNNDSSLTCSAMIIGDEVIWKLIKIDIPYIPDWKNKRKYLNYNYVSYHFHLEKSYETPGSSSSTNFNYTNRKTKPNPPEDRSTMLTLGLDKQEKLLLDDLLLNMLGMEGIYIKRNTKKFISNEREDPTNAYKNFTIKFDVEPHLENPTCGKNILNLDPSLLFMVYKILPLSNYYDRITNFINLSTNIETGLIAKSLCEGLRKIIREYILFINQLEAEYQANNLDIQKLWYLCQPSIKILENVQKLCYQASLIKGGGLINIVYTFLQNTTDAELKKLYKFILDKSIQPYFNMMKLWVCKGFLNDNFNEFMVISNPNYNIELLSDYYYELFWDKKFIVNKENIPDFFNNFADKIFFIGKTLNILRECKKVVNCPYEKEFESFMNDNNSIFESDVLINFQNLISKIYEWANITLKNLLFKEENILSIFKSIKRFYFLECGDFYTHFIDVTDELLSMEKNQIMVDKFESIIDNTIRSTSAVLDTNRDLFSFAISKMIMRTEKLFLDRYTKILESNNIPTIIQLINELENDSSFFNFNDSKIIESLVVEMKVKWPLNLIFSKKNLLKYQIIFRQLLFLKYQEKKLTESWIVQQHFKDTKIVNYIKKSYILRDKMIGFIKNLIYYLFNEVIEPNYIYLHNELLNSKSIEDVIKSHDNFLNICLKECMLDDPDVLSKINDILNVSNLYSKILIKMFHSYSTDEKYIVLYNKYIQCKKKFDLLIERREEMNKHLETLIKDGFYERFLLQYTERFEERLKLFLDKINKM